MASAFRRKFASEVREYLQRSPRQLPSKYFYDALGSVLFNAICELPWYRITRGENALLSRHAADMLGSLGNSVTLAELGCGNGEKLVTLVTAARRSFDLIQLVDISPAALEEATRRLQALGVSRMVAHNATYEAGLSLVAARRPDDAPLLLLFLGSNIGNFDPPADRALLTAIRASLRPGDALLLGSDLVKPEQALLLAYDDPLQVTAAFNRNLLRRINDELGGTFDLGQFAHRALWNRSDRRVEMHLVSLAPQAVRVAAADLEVKLDAGEWIWTESSYKYEPEQIVAEGRAAGFTGAAQWVEPDARFALTRFAV